MLHRQFSSPSTRLPESPTASIHDLARDSKDVLVQRLNDLSIRLVAEEALKDEDITALHIDVDRMERVMKKSVGIPQEESSHERRSPSSVGTLREQEDDLFWGPPFSPNRKVIMRLPGSPVHTSHARLQGSLEMSPNKASLLAQEADALNEQLSKALKELQARKEESNVRFSKAQYLILGRLTSKHIHDLLVTRAEKAAQRITELESRVQDLYVFAFVFLSYRLPSKLPLISVQRC